MKPAPAAPEIANPSLAEKVAFLNQVSAEANAPGEAQAIETHMSWVFLAGKKVLKLKKPVRFAYLDFSTLARRETACRAELRLNHRLAPSVYIEVMPLSVSERGLNLNGEGRTIDWLVIMWRLDEAFMLDRRIETQSIERTDACRLADALARFYGGTKRTFASPAVHLREWRRSVAENRALLFHSEWGLPTGLVRQILGVQQAFLVRESHQLAQRTVARRILDAHGDLRPEHIWLGDPLQIIDCLEFNARLRAVDPFDEIAYLSIECERLGAPWFGRRVVAHLAYALHDRVSAELFHFYRCYRAMLRARLAIAHLLEPKPRTPEKWPLRAGEYLRIAENDAAELDRYLRKRASHPRSIRRRSAGSPRR